MTVPLARAVEKCFSAVMELSQPPRLKTMQVMNTRLVELYWQGRTCISHKLEQAEWGLL
jgi:hypothetical protein